jgi:hypothetical protein
MPIATLDNAPAGMYMNNININDKLLGDFWQSIGLLENKKSQVRNGDTA